MRKMLRVVPVALLLFALPTAAQASGSQSGTYVAAAALASAAGGRCVSQAGTCVALLGMAAIPAGPISVTVRITDSSGPGTPYTVCQHNSTDQTTPLCGDGVGDVRYDVCSTGASRLFTGFTTTNQILISVWAADSNLVCEGNGTVGTYTATW